MTASLVATPNVRYLILADLPNSFATRGLSSAMHSVLDWIPADDESHVPKHTKHAKHSPHARSTLVRLLDPIDAYSRQLKARLGNLANTVSAYDDRISVLEEQACAEGYFLNSGSKETFQDFFRKNPLIRLGYLVLLENGNLRAVWKGHNASHIGLQFLENGHIQYVLFKQRHPDLPVSRAFGRDTPSGIVQQISALQLGEILYP